MKSLGKIGAVFLVMLWTACSEGDVKNGAGQGDDRSNNTTEAFTGTPLDGSLVRTDGVYAARTKGLVYFMKFFPKGNAVIVGGPKKSEELLHSLLKEDAVQGESNVHNVPVTLRNDSILFVTKAMKGEIEYRGELLTGDSIMFLKHSHINGKKAFVTYSFEPN